MTTWVGKPPCKCDICRAPITTVFSDAKIGSSWANVCDKCFKDLGGSYGLGRGQRYEKQPDGTFKKTKG